jgi:hypothetical protein
MQPRLLRLSKKRTCLEAGSPQVAYGPEEQTKAADLDRGVMILARQKRDALLLPLPSLSVSRYGIGWLGTGATSQMADAQGGRGGVGISNSLPWVAAEPPLIQAPVKVSLLR